MFLMCNIVEIFNLLKQFLGDKLRSDPSKLWVVHPRLKLKYETKKSAE